jgi:hypothetical protein
LADAGVDVVLSWYDYTYPINDLYVQYFLREAYNPGKPHLSVDEAVMAAYTDLGYDMTAFLQGGAEPGEQTDPDRVLANIDITGARNGNTGSIILYPPRYGAKKKN